MKKIIVMVIMVATMISMLTGCMSNANVDEEIVRQYCEMEGKTLVNYYGIEYDSVMENEVYRYTATDNVNGHTYSCTTNAEYAQNRVDR